MSEWNSVIWQYLGGKAGIGTQSKFDFNCIIYCVENKGYDI